MISDTIVATVLIMGAFAAKSAASFKIVKPTSMLLITASPTPGGLGERDVATAGGRRDGGDD